MCGIFAYLNHEVSRDRRTILKTLIAGLKRLEYRGYDSAGLACDGANQSTLVVKRSGKVVNLEQAIETQSTLVVKRSGKVVNLEQAIETHPELKDFMDTPLSNHSGIAHTRWATHGPPNEVNCHPHLSTPDAEFTVVHNGIITNCRDLRALLERKGCVFVSETDTESIAKLVKFVYDKKLAASDGEKPDFHEVVEDTTSQLEGAFALVFKSNHYPHQLVATRRGSPLLVGIKPNLEVSCGQLPAMIQVHKMEARRPYDEADESQLLATSAATTATTAATAPSTTTAAVAAGPDIIDLGASGAGKAGGSLANRVPSVSEYGVGEPVEYFFASDASAIVEHTKKIVYLEDEDIASIKDGRINIHRSKLRSGQVPQTREIKTVEIELQEIMKGKFSHFMVKEIYEQPESTTNTMRGRLRPDAAAAAAGGSQVVLGGLKEHIASMKRCRRLLFIACGTSYNSAIATRQFLEESTLLPVVCDIASDFLDRQCPIFRDDVCFFISQSGETADTLAALRYCKARGALIVGITNTVGSSISRESDCGVHANAGPEIGVASTKAYTSQVLVMILFGLTMSEDQVSAQPRRAEVIQALQELPGKIQQMIEMDDAIKLAAARFTNAENLLIMGRGYSFANCLEGALKIKELTYIHAEGILAGELKHGPLALVDSDMPIIMLLMRDSSYTKSINALEQIVARGGRPLVICPEGDIPTVGGADAFDAIEVPSTADCLACVLSIIPLQLLSYHIACAKGLDVDCPRNLAKSVTVE